MVLGSVLAAAVPRLAAQLPEVQRCWSAVCAEAGLAPPAPVSRFWLTVPEVARLARMLLMAQRRPQRLPGREQASQSLVYDAPDRQGRRRQPRTAASALTDDELYEALFPPQYRPPEAGSEGG